LQIDYEYLKGLLEAFEKAESPYTDINELKNNGFSSEEDIFPFHMAILYDKQFIESRSPEYAFGYQSTDIGPRWSVLDLRLTAPGHEFIASLNDPDVWTEICKNFKKSGIDTVKSVAIDLAKGYAKKKVKALIGE
jgi:hypothetical protein